MRRLRTQISQARTTKSHDHATSNHITISCWWCTQPEPLRSKLWRGTWDHNQKHTLKQQQSSKSSLFNCMASCSGDLQANEFQWTTAKNTKPHSYLNFQHPKNLASKNAHKENVNHRSATRKERFQTQEASDRQIRVMIPDLDWNPNPVNSWIVFCIKPQRSSSNIHTHAKNRGPKTGAAWRHQVWEGSRSNTEFPCPPNEHDDTDQCNPFPSDLLRRYGRSLLHTWTFPNANNNVKWKTLRKPSWGGGRRMDMSICRQRYKSVSWCKQRFSFAFFHEVERISGRACRIKQFASVPDTSLPLRRLHRCIRTRMQLDTGGKPSTWFPPEGLVEYIYFI